MSSTRKPLSRVGVLVVLTALLTGCAALSREGRADDVTAAIEALPGVEDVYGDYANSITVGASYSLRVGLEEGATEGQVAEVARVWTDEVGRDGLPGHDLALHLHTPDRADNLTANAQDGKPVDPTAAVPLWFQLRASLPDLSLALEDGTRTVSLTSPDVPSTLQAVRSAADRVVQPDLHWTITGPSSLILRLAGPLPDDRVADWLRALADDTDMWHVDLTADSVTTRAFLLDDRTWTPDIARRHLDLVAALGRPVTHTEVVPDADDIVVEVGGCRTEGSALEQELNREYGDC